MMPRLLQRSIRIVLSLVPCVEQVNTYDRVARLLAVRVHGCTLPPSAHGLDSLKGVLPPSVPAEPDDCGVRRAPVSVHRYMDVTVYYVLHFFSGQRRLGDFQDWLDQAFAVTHYVSCLGH